MSIYKKLKEKDFSVTELSNYLEISRPSLYKYFDFYDQKKWSLIPKEILKFLKLITKNPLIGKRHLIKYLIDDYKKDDYDKNELLVSTIKKANSSLNSEEINFIIECITSKKIVNDMLKSRKKGGKNE